jgi:hypothetical protein
MASAAERSSVLPGEKSGWRPMFGPTSKRSFVAARSLGLDVFGSWKRFCAEEKYVLEACGCHRSHDSRDVHEK